MREGQAAWQPLIHCTPPSDLNFLASVSRSYTEATELMSGEAAVVVGTLVRLRRQYPMATIIPLSLASRDAPFVVWLVSREGWTEIEPAPPQPGSAAAMAATAGRPARYDA